MKGLSQSFLSKDRSLRVAFYTYPEWAFGSIHFALCKELHKHGILANVIDWNREFSEKERKDLERQYDVFVTVPGNAISLLVHSFGVPYEKIIGVAHGRYDIDFGLSEGNNFNLLRDFAGVSPDLADYASQRGVDREMKIVRNGIHFDYFYQPASNSLRVLGYGGAFRYFNFEGSRDIKRGHLALEVADKVGLPFKPAEQQSYLTMPQYYSQVDAILVSSLEESCALPLMEAAAAGRLPVSTQVGVARDVPGFPGILLPFDEELYVEEAVKQLSICRRGDLRFSLACREAQEYAKENYDWSRTIHSWLNLLGSLG